MTDPTVDALAAERGPCRFDPYYCRAHNGNRHSVIDDRCVADAGYVVVRAEDVERLREVDAAARVVCSYPRGDRELYAFNRLRAALATKETP